MNNMDKTQDSMEQSPKKLKREESKGPASPNAESPADYDALLKCVVDTYGVIFKRKFLIFINSLVERGEEKLINYVGANKAKYAFTSPGGQSVEEHWDALAKAEMAVSESKESRLFFEKPGQAPSSPKELAGYFKQPFANTWQENELAICEGVLGIVEDHCYISFPFPLSGPKYVTHIVYHRDEPTPEQEQASPCFKNYS